jgi:hypothetical protein
MKKLNQEDRKFILEYKNDVTNSKSIEDIIEILCFQFKQNFDVLEHRFNDLPNINCKTINE